MLTDAEKRTMRDSVRGMPLSDAVKLPIYDDFRVNPQFLQRCAFLDGAVPDAQQTDTEARAEAHRDHMIHQQSNAWNGDATSQDAAASVPEYTKDGRHISTLTDSELAYHRYVSTQTNAWKR